MSLYEVVAGDIGTAEDINQIVREVNGVSLSGTLASGTTSTLAHGLGKLPRFIFGYWSNVNQASADAGDRVINQADSAVSQGVYFRDASTPTNANKSADGTNIYVRNSHPAIIYYRIYVM